MTDKPIENMEVSPPLKTAEALRLFAAHQARGYSPFMEEEDNGVYIVHRGNPIGMPGIQLFPPIAGLS